MLAFGAGVSCVFGRPLCNRGRGVLRIWQGWPVLRIDGDADCRSARLKVLLENTRHAQLGERPIYGPLPHPAFVCNLGNGFRAASPSPNMMEHPERVQTQAAVVDVRADNKGGLWFAVLGWYIHRHP